MPDTAPSPKPDGRGLRWRLGMALTSAVSLAGGAALLVWPQTLAYAVAGAFGLLGLFFLVSALAAKGR